MLNLIALIVDIASALFMVLFILLHAGKGSGLSDMFGGAGSLAGGTALERRLDRITVITACLFGLATVFLSWRSAHGHF